MIGYGPAGPFKMFKLTPQENVKWSGINAAHFFSSFSFQKSHKYFSLDEMEEEKKDLYALRGQKKLFFSDAKTLLYFLTLPDKRFLFRGEEKNNPRFMNRSGSEEGKMSVFILSSGLQKKEMKERKTLMTNFTPTLSSHAQVSN